MDAATEYDPRYLAGIVLFNRRAFFEAHEVWESLWLDCDATARRFYQGLIQAAVAVYHGGNGNAVGARRLFHSARKYMSSYPSPYLGLDIVGFWEKMQSVFGDLLAEPGAIATPSLVFASIPNLVLHPAPALWPDPDGFLSGL